MNETNETNEANVVPGSLKYVVVTSQVLIALATASYCQLLTVNRTKEIFIFGIIPIFASILSTYLIFTFYAREEEIKLSDRAAILVAHISFVPSFLAYYLLMSLVAFGAKNILGI